MKSFQSGRAEYYQGMPLVTLCGSHYEMGLQYGVLLKEELSGAMERLKDIEKAVEMTAPWYFRPFIAGMFKAKVRKQLLNSLPTKYRDELKGIAEGSGLPYDEILFAAAMAGTFEFACTSIVSQNDESILLGRNLDWAPGFFGEMPVLVRFQPQNELAYVSAGFIFAPMAVVTGMNERGLAVSVNIVSYYKDRKAAGMPVYYAVREILSRAGSLTETETILRAYHPPESWIISVASAGENRGSIYELTAHDISVRDGVSGDSIYALNGFQSNPMNQKYTPLLASSNVINDSRTRILDAVLQEKRIRGVDDMLEVLGNDGFPLFEDTHVSGKGINHEGTLQTAVMDPRSKSIYFGYSSVFAGWAAVYKYELRTQEVSMYRAQNELMECAEIRSLKKWYPDYFLQLYSGRGHVLLESIRADGWINPLTLYCLYDIWKNDQSLKDNAYFGEVFGNIQDDSSRQGFVHFLAGSFFMKNGDWEKAEKHYLTALQKYCAFDEKIQILSRLAVIYEKQAEHEKMEQTAQACIDLMKSHQQDFLLTREETDLIKEMEKYRRQEERIQ